MTKTDSAMLTEEQIVVVIRLAKIALGEKWHAELLSLRDLALEGLRARNTREEKGYVSYHRGRAL